MTINYLELLYNYIMIQGSFENRKRDLNYSLPLETNGDNTNR